MGSFAAGVKRYRLNVERIGTDKFRRIVFEADRRIVERTPVDTGRARGNWHPSIGTAPESVGDTGLRSGDEAMAAVQGVAAQLKLGDTAWLANNLKYVRVLEYGEFPDPVKRGTYIRKGSTRNGVAGPGYIKLSQGGYSLQAPAGMVRITAIEFGQIVSETRPG